MNTRASCLTTRRAFMSNTTTTNDMRTFIDAHCPLYAIAINDALRGAHIERLDDTQKRMFDLMSIDSNVGKLCVDVLTHVESLLRHVRDTYGGDNTQRVNIASIAYDVMNVYLFG